MSKLLKDNTELSAGATRQVKLPNRIRLSERVWLSDVDVSGTTINLVYEAGEIIRDKELIDRIHKMDYIYTEV